MLEQLEKSLHDFLPHLYDPAYRVPEPLLAIAGCGAERGYECACAAVIRAIDTLRPAPDVPPSARQRRLYLLLYHRFERSLTQEETSELLGLTSRHLRREEQEAISLLLRRLLELSPAPIPEEWRAGMERGRSTTDESGEPAPPAWRSQMQQELAWLQRGAPSSVADVAEAVERVAELGRALSTQRSIEMVVEPLGARSLAIIHPSVLLQVMAMTLEAFLTRMSKGSVRFAVERTGSRITISLTASPVAAGEPPDLEPLRSILATQNGSCSANRQGEELAVRLELAAAEDVHVLVVDDNADMVYLYRRYTVGTRFSVQHFEGQEPLFRHVEANPPAAIVLDVMMPDADGWQLLTHLHEHPLTRSLPVIVCSVIKGEQLALALGAARYLAKPITRNQFLEALEAAVDGAANSVGREQQR